MYLNNSSSERTWGLLQWMGSVKWYYRISFCRWDRSPRHLWCYFSNVCRNQFCEHRGAGIECADVQQRKMNDTMCKRVCMWSTHDIMYECKMYDTMKSRSKYSSAIYTAVGQPWNKRIGEGDGWQPAVRTEKYREIFQHENMGGIKIVGQEKGESN